jgi:hypothetical protein
MALTAFRKEEFNKSVFVQIVNLCQLNNQQVHIFALTLCLKTFTKLENQNIEVRAVMKFLTMKEMNAEEIHHRIANMHGKSELKYST